MLFPYLTILLLLHGTAPSIASPSTATSTSASTITRTESYAEQLRITPLVDGKVHSEFNFIMRSAGDAEEESTGELLGSNSIVYHHTHLPSQLLAIITHYSISSFHLTLSSGRYLSSYPPLSPLASAPSGIQLYAYLASLEGESEEEEEERWRGFRGAVGGLFCAGLGERKGDYEGGMKGGRPEWSFAVEDYVDEREHKLYHIILPRLSSTCTESLTPFLALLPCSSHAGLSSLLNPHRLFDGDYTLLGAHYSIVEGGIGEVRLVVGSVSDPIRRDRLKGGLGRRDFSMLDLYDRRLEHACPVAENSTIELVLPVNSYTPFSIEPKNGMLVEKGFVAWDTSKNLAEPLDVSMSWESESQFIYPQPSTLPLAPISTRRLLTGYGQERGSIGIEITNNLDIVAEVIWLEVWPWWVRGFISTLQGSIISGPQSNTTTTTALITSLNYTPPRSRRRPTTLQALLSLPPRTTTHFVLAYESAYLWYTEYPPDAERGLELPSATLSLLHPPPQSSSPLSLIIPPQHLLKYRGTRLRIYTTSAIISVPTPDFSMPYNVIILTSTIMALFFGSVMNALVRDWSVVNLIEEEEEEQVVDKVMEGNEEAEEVKTGEEVPLGVTLRKKIERLRID